MQKKLPKKATTVSIQHSPGTAINNECKSFQDEKKRWFKTPWLCDERAITTDRSQEIKGARDRHRPSKESAKHLLMTILVFGASGCSKHCNSYTLSSTSTYFPWVNHTTPLKQKRLYLRPLAGRKNCIWTMVAFLGSGQKISTAMLADYICVHKFGIYLQLSSANWTVLMKGFCCHITTRCNLISV